ncbi:cytochrome P450 [Roseibium album]|uniref:cytochrome P450 n=1 Tax=Roseibium album TaxID=311410 RepID=UPI003BAFA607
MTHFVTNDCSVHEPHSSENTSSVFQEDTYGTAGPKLSQYSSSEAYVSSDEMTYSMEIRGYLALRYLRRFRRDRLGVVRELSKCEKDVLIALPGMRFHFLFNSKTREEILGPYFGKLDRGLGLSNLRDAIGPSMLTSSGATWMRARQTNARTFRAFTADGVFDAWQRQKKVQRVATILTCDFGEEFSSRILSNATTGDPGGLDKQTWEAKERTSQLISRLMTTPFKPLQVVQMCLGQAWHSTSRNLTQFAQVKMHGRWQGLPASERLGLLFAGGETISALLAWTLLRLAHSPEWQELVRNRSEGALRAFLFEVLRLHPPVWMISRRANCDFSVCNIRIRAGDHVLLPIWAYHRDPKCFVNPKSFDPTRFFDTTREMRKSFLPFGIGPHTCPGRHCLSSVFASIILPLLEHYEVSAGQSQPDWNGVPGLSLFPAKDAAVLLKSRNKVS